VVRSSWALAPHRLPDAPGSAPEEILPRAPGAISTLVAEWAWSEIDSHALLQLAENFGVWCEGNVEADSPFASLWGLLELHRKQFGKIVVRAVSTAGSAAERQLDDYLAALVTGVGAPKVRQVTGLQWLEFALNPFPDLFAAPPGGVSSKVNDALLRRRLTERQLGVVYDHLTRADQDVMGGMFGLATYGGRVNTVAPATTASWQRDSIADLACATGWLDRSDEERNLAWVRAFYRDPFSTSGGVPAPGDSYGGALINHPDTDLADPALNTSGLPWHALYYGESYARLQRVKARWDPRNVFRHRLSIVPAIP
jgi:hypothetical protein